MFSAPLVQYLPSKRRNTHTCFRVSDSPMGSKASARSFNSFHRYKQRNFSAKKKYAASKWYSHGKHDVTWSSPAEKATSYCAVLHALRLLDTVFSIEMGQLEWRPNTGITEINSIIFHLSKRSIFVCRPIDNKIYELYHGWGGHRVFHTDNRIKRDGFNALSSFAMNINTKKKKNVYFHLIRNKNV